MSHFRKKFYTSDTHFGHALMLTSCNRPYKSADQMDEALIRAWNDFVRAEDIVYHLGDFSMNLGDEDRVRSIFARLMGSKVLVLGNHDYKRPNVIHPTLARLDWMTSPTTSLETTDEGRRVYLSHYSHRVWPGSHKGSVHFYGHSHGKLPAVGCSRDVGVDALGRGYAPQTFKQLTAQMDLEDAR
ncbi:metallophosphoesterase family protein [Rhizobium sp. CFBP 8752]|uniref:metallophosphoesterase n=1 Tax=Rhizobium sp. CFBP 8752 TaxID=2775301 RepID=UPI001786F801|nr:metallophosphoesterase [Rhizobium sp. CFBP 8752]MBD8663054.1 metallophosphoesterase family protein [Rhizobium sp. CFBP 8752]